MSVGRTPIGKQVPLRLSDDLKTRAETEATRRGISLAELMRTALEHEMERGPVEVAGQGAIEALRAEGYTVEK